LSDDERQEQESAGEDERQEQESAGEDGRVTDAETAFEEYASDNECPECGEPVIDVRASCPNCGYEYKESDYGDKEAGSDFVSGSAVDDEGNEIPDDETGTGDDDSGDEAGSGDDESRDDSGEEGEDDSEEEDSLGES